MEENSERRSVEVNEQDKRETCQARRKKRGKRRKKRRGMREQRADKREETADNRYERRETKEQIRRGEMRTLKERSEGSELKIENREMEETDKADIKAEERRDEARKGRRT